MKSGCHLYLVSGAQDDIAHEINVGDFCQPTVISEAQARAAAGPGRYCLLVSSHNTVMEGAAAPIRIEESYLPCQSNEIVVQG